MYDEFTVNNDTCDRDTLVQIADALNKIAYDNLDDDAKRTGFNLNETRIVSERGVWGAVRQEREDIDTLTRQFPDYDFILTRTWEPNSETNLEEARNYSRVLYRDGRKVKTFAAKIVWEEEKTGADFFLL